MNLKKQLQADLKAAMRNQDAEKKSALRMVLSGIQYAEVEKSEELSDQDILGVLQKEVRRREDALAMIRDAGRDDLAAEEVAQLEILKAYLPTQLTVDEITTLAKTVIAEVGAASPSDVGMVMKDLMPQVKGKADGRMVNQVVRDLLAV
ncbi:MAG: GatB/YqeY domain-containing protein [Anaerolineae bacterium]|nr:GatB/YqeY domain-containing protein [Anaerolineae bacterium]